MTDAGSQCRVWIVAVRLFMQINQQHTR
jgi:hypothetical protein